MTSVGGWKRIALQIVAWEVGIGIGTCVALVAIAQYVTWPEHSPGYASFELACLNRK